MMKQTLWKSVLVAGLIVVATVLHYTIDVQAGAVHDVLLRSYYLPIVLAGLWFGVRGGLLAAFAVSIVFFPHAMHGWNAPYTTIFRLIEILMYFVIGGLTGWFSSRTETALNAEKHASIERKRALEDLKAKTTRLFETEEELRRSERLAALGRMSGGLAHEIRNPLASIKTSVEMLQERCGSSLAAPQTDPAVDLLAVVAEETDRLNRILTEFLRFARAEIRQEDEAAAECVIGEVLANTASLVGPDLSAAGVVIDSNTEQLSIKVSLGEDRLHQVLLNLLLNAADAMPDGGAVRVGIAGEDSKTVMLSIEDSGPGIPSEIAPSVFDPFFSTKDGGVGLGLSIVGRLMEVCGGSIRIDPDSTDGARFLLGLPKAGS